ncbi:MAG: hypothetical protein CO090_00930 [Acidobacteria bacterium CG_4_9_14_3_um_filter_49_7]|nr:MAG: hypothetical protein CO090_00930 [Acidobacteria bacterium CG_4_9_14_3_um_filter_49_7]
MRQFILLTSIMLLGFSPLIAQENEHNTKQRGKSKIVVNITPYKYQVSDTPYAHPQTLTSKQAARILASIFIEKGQGVPVLNSEDRMMLAPKMVKDFGSLGKKEQLEITKTWEHEQKDGTYIEDYSIHLYLCFVKADTLYVAISYKNLKPEETYHLVKGRFMKWMKSKDGKNLLNIVLMDKSLWTTNFDKLVFDKNIDFDPKTIKKTIDKHAEQKEKLKGTQSEKTEAATLSFEQLEKELKRLNDMKDKGLISEEEYKKARSRLMKLAGIGK